MRLGSRSHNLPSATESGGENRRFCYEWDSIYRERMRKKQRASLSRQGAADETMTTRKIRYGAGHSDTRPDIKYALRVGEGGIQLSPPHIKHERGKVKRGTRFEEKF